MKLTPGQVREILGLPQETFRHWKSKLPPLANRNGHRPCFTYGDLFAIAVIQTLITQAGVQVSALAPVAEKLFNVCDMQPWAAIEQLSLVIEPAEEHIAFVAEQETPRHSGLAIIVACGPLIAKLRKALLMDQEAVSQETLKFPPTVVASERRSLGGSA